MIAGIEKDSRRILVFSDGLAFVVTSLIILSGRAYLASHGAGLRSAIQSESMYLFFVGVTLLWCLSLGATGAYGGSLSFRQTCMALIKGGVFCALITWTVAPAGWVAIPKNEFVVLFSLAFALALLFRASSVVPGLMRLAGLSTGVRVLVFGEGVTTDHVEGTFRARCGYSTLRWPVSNGCPASHANGSSAESLTVFLNTFRPQEVIIVGASLQNNHPELVHWCSKAGIPWQFVPDLEVLGFRDLQANLVGGLPLLTPKSSVFTGLNLRLKQVIDLTFGGILLIPTAPVMAAIWLLIRLDSKGPAIIVQPRLGYKGKMFNLYKFRTMRHNADDAVHRAYVRQWVNSEASANEAKNGQKVFKLADDNRVTKLGRMLRRYSLDELPQIFNVLKLEMSLVGPRPCISYEAASYQDWHKERLEAVPGLTGLWQVSGRNRLSFNDMVRLDVEYLRNWTPTQDFRLIVKTIPAIFRGTGF
jgi:exopolysaccharide biosynthesis polyprenyl glycosylphosphotransferase